MPIEYRASRRVRVRVDIDETHVAKVNAGQRAYTQADAFGEQKFWDRVVQVGELAGPKTAPTDPVLSRKWCWPESLLQLRRMTARFRSVPAQA